MRIEDIRAESRNGSARAAARVVWEDRDAPDAMLSLSVPERFSADLDADANVFALAAALPAMRHGEQRLAVEGTLCPQLRHGLETAAGLLRTWHGPPRILPRLEPSKGFEPRTPRSEPRTAMLLTGGVDSLALLRQNRRDLPVHHPGAVRDGLVISYGFEGVDRDYRIFDEHLGRLAGVADETGLTLVPVTSEIGLLDTDAAFWTQEFHGPALMAAALAVSRRMSDLLVASSVRYDLLHRVFTGSHPLLDPHYTTAALRVHHVETRLSRLEKVAALADWDAALRCLRVCTDPAFPRGAQNCGACEKCVRTRIQLLVTGGLERCTTFPGHAVEPEALRVLHVNTDYLRAWYEELLAPLREIGRPDLAEAIEAKIARYRRRQRRRAAPWYQRLLAP